MYKLLNENKRFENPESRLTYMINQLKDRLHSDEINRIYNRLLIERAALRKNLEKEKSKNIITSFCEKLSRKNRKRLICDYF